MSEDAMNYLIYLSDNSPWKLSVEETALGLQPIKIPFKRLAEKIQTSIQSRVIRKISMREVVVKVINGRTRKNLYIPNIEFSEMVRVEEGLKFLNVSVTQNSGNIENSSYYVVRDNKSEIKKCNKNNKMVKYIENNKVLQKNGTQSWYHGTKVENVKQISDLDPSLCKDYGDFGKGVYFADMKQVSEEYAKRVREDHCGKIFEGVWFNNELDRVYRKIRESMSPFLETLLDRNGEKIKVMVYPKKDRKWAEAILYGWSGVRVKDVDMVIGPLSHNSTIATMSRYTKGFLEKTLQEKKNTIDKFDKESEILQYGDIIPFQMCCYRDRVISCFTQINCTYT